jgi:hypothetical protein
VDNKVREAVTSLRAEVYDEAELITVTAADLRTLLAWAEGEAKNEDADTCELETGDRVVLRRGYDGKIYTHEGAKGTVIRLITNSFTQYPYEVSFDEALDEYPVQFSRSELRKLED